MHLHVMPGGSGKRPQRSCAPLAVLEQKPEMYVLDFLIFTIYDLAVFVGGLVRVPLTVDFKAKWLMPTTAASTDVWRVDHATFDEIGDRDLETLFSDLFIADFHLDRSTRSRCEMHCEFRHVAVPSASS